MIRRGNDQDSYSDYEDIELQPGAGTPDVVLIGTPSESSDSVEIVEELCVFPTQKETQTRPATPPRRPVAPRRPRATIPKTSKTRRDAEQQNVNRNLSIFNYYCDKDNIPVNDLIDYVATVGGGIISSGKPMQPPQLFSKKRALLNVFNTTTRRTKGGTNQLPESVVDNYIKSSIQSSQFVFERLQAQANKIAGGHCADFIDKNPFLYPWEHDKDRMDGGNWRERREKFMNLTKPAESGDADGENESDSENTPPLVRPGKRRLKSVQRSLPSDGGDPKKSAVAEVQPILLGYRWPEGSNQSSSPPESIIFWR